MSVEARVEKSKFELGAPDEGGADVDKGDLPWGYGQDRITALVRDPDSAYLYWEITDEGIAGARARLGPAGLHGWCSLRIYDVTGREFDGTNANDYFDIRVDRTDREHFVMVRRPASSMSAEIGIKTHEGYFQAIARSGRADFPRNSPSPNTSLEWMTVTSKDAPPSVAPYRSRYRGPDPSLPGREGAGYFDVWRAAFAPSMPEPPVPEQQRQASSAPARERSRPRPAHVERWWRLDEWRSERPAGLRFSPWVGTREEAAWRAGPFPLEPGDPERLAIALLGEAPAYWVDGEAGFVAYGPWRVVVSSHDVEPTRRVLATWSMRWVQATTPLAERWTHGLERRVVYGYQREGGGGGASDAFAAAERGASELWRLGASERRAIGASEGVLGGASEAGPIGASRVLFAGASATAPAGGSELSGSSARLGASEKLAEARAAERWGGRLEPVDSAGRKEG
jgi:hypothetical protein